MKKISIALATLILTVCSVSCGSNQTTEEELSSAFISAYEAHEAAENETSAITEIIETDPFKGVSITIPDIFDDISDRPTVYPSCVKYDVQCDDPTVALIFENNAYESVITKSDIESITVTVTINEDVVKGLEEEQGIRLVPTSQDFTIDMKQYRMDLVSVSQLTSENINAICEGIKNHIISDIESENDNIEDQNAAGESIGGNNPENQPEINDLIDTDLTLEKCYVDEFSNSDKVELGVSPDNKVFAIFKNKNNQYFLASAVPVFVNELFDDEFTEYNTFKYSKEDSWESEIYYPSLDDAQNDIYPDPDKSKPIKELK